MSHLHVIRFYLLGQALDKEGAKFTTQYVIDSSERIRSITSARRELELVFMIGEVTSRRLVEVRVTCLCRVCDVTHSCV